MVHAPNFRILIHLFLSLTLLTLKPLALSPEYSEDCSALCLSVAMTSLECEQRPHSRSSSFTRGPPGRRWISRQRNSHVTSHAHRPDGQLLTASAHSDASARQEGRPRVPGSRPIRVGPPWKCVRRLLFHTTALLFR